MQRSSTNQDKVYERFNNNEFGQWVPEGAAFGSGPTDGAADSGAAGSDVFMGTLTSPKFKTGKELFLHVRVRGTKSDPKLKERGPLRFTIVADGYKGQHVVPDGTGAPYWKTLRLTFERERICYFEIVDRSRDGHISVDEIVFSDSKEPPSTILGEAADPVAEPVDTGRQTKLQSLLAEKAKLETQVPPSEFAMVAEDRDCRDARVNVRGNHKNPGEQVPRRFLQVIAGDRQPPVQSGSGRLQMAEYMAGDANPLTARVMVNRIWKQHFGNGLVRSVDNFGHMGEAPTHPELLDYLAANFIESGWSVKAMHRMIVLSSAYQMSSLASTEAAKTDPANKLLQHMPVRRLEAEEIRDGILAVSGRLDPKMYGPSVPPHISDWQNGRGKPVSVPLDGDGRRSIYIQVRRNFMTPLFLAFDYPAPISTIGARTVSTVPSQALMMMNNAFIAGQAVRWASATTDAESDPVRRVQRMYLAAFARPASQPETDMILSFVRSQAARPETEVWADVAHVILNSAEFIYLE